MRDQSLLHLLFLTHSAAGCSDVADDAAPGYCVVYCDVDVDVVDVAADYALILISLLLSLLPHYRSAYYNTVIVPSLSPDSAAHSPPIDNHRPATRRPCTHRNSATPCDGACRR